MFFDNIYKIDKYLARLIKDKKREEKIVYIQMNMSHHYKLQKLE